jgi:hypothetical protein
LYVIRTLLRNYLALGSGGPFTEVGPPERDKTDRSQELNDGWVKRPLGVSTEYIEKPRQKLPIQFVQVLTNFWYSHT